MLIPERAFAAWLTVAVIGYIWAPRTWVPGELVTAAMMNTLRDLFNAIHDYFFPTQVFRGLVLRTHPNADVAASKVYLDHADEIVMHDGERVADWNDLEANIASAGAGGLDTGAEGASRWYEIHAIRKSTDGTKNLILHRAKTYDIDQSNTTVNTTATFRLAAGQQVVAQRFQAGVSFPAVMAEWLLTKVASPTGRVWTTIEAESAGYPSGAALATSDKIDVATIAATAQAVRFIFRQPFTLVSGTAYWLVLRGDFAMDATNYLNVSCNSSSVYANGKFSLADSTPTWSDFGAGAYDAYFRIYTIQNDTAVTMPSGYDQRSLIGWVYNNSGSNFLEFIAHDREYKHRQAETIVSGGTAAIGTLVNLGAVVPPIPVLVTTLELQANTVDQVIVVGPNVMPSQFGIFWQCPRAGAYIDTGCALPVVFQFTYYSISGGTTDLFIRSFRW